MDDLQIVDLSEWHGWQYGNLGTIHVGPMPGRKSICLYLIQGSVMYTMAYFRNEEEAHRFLDFFDRMFAPVLESK